MAKREKYRIGLICQLIAIILLVIGVSHWDGTKVMGGINPREETPLFQRQLDTKLEGWRLKKELVPQDNKKHTQQALIIFSEGASACIASGCAASACAGSACTGSGCVGSACGDSGCVGSACIVSGCVGSGCVASGCVSSGCGGSACAGSACAGSVCASSTCIGSACAGSVCAGSGCAGSVCAGCQSRLNQDPGNHRASAPSSMCSFNTVSPGRIVGFNAAQSSLGFEVSWIITGVKSEHYRLYRISKGLIKVQTLVSAGPASSDTLMRVMDSNGTSASVYLIEVVDEAGRLIRISTEGAPEGTAHYHGSHYHNDPA